MAFASPLALSTVCTAYGKTPQSLAGLTGSVYYTNGSTGGVTGGISVSLPVSLGNFSGKYISSIGTLPNTNSYGTGGFYEEAFAQNGTAGHGIEAHSGWSSLSYVMYSNTLISITASFYLTPVQTGTATGQGTNNPVFTFTLDGVPYVNTNTGFYTPVITPASSTLVIRVQGNASNINGDQASADKTWNFTISNTGVNHV